MSSQDTRTDTSPTQTLDRTQTPALGPEQVGTYRPPQMGTGPGAGAPDGVVAALWSPRCPHCGGAELRLLTALQDEPCDAPVQADAAALARRLPAEWRARAARPVPPRPMLGKLLLLVPAASVVTGLTVGGIAHQALPPAAGIAIGLGAATLSAGLAWRTLRRASTALRRALAHDHARRLEVWRRSVLCLGCGQVASLPPG